MSHDHSHEHEHGNIKLAFFLNFGFTILEFFGGMYVNSVAIISDALHDLGDSLSLGLSWFLDHKSKEGANSSFTFGYTRFSLLGALINSLVLIAGSVFVINEAVARILSPEHTDAQGMLLFAIVGVAVNGYAAWKVSHGKTLNERVISWHLLEDVLGWAAVLVVSIVLLFKDIHYLDPALSLFITAYVLWNVVKRLKETLHIFLQGTPDDISIDELREKFLEQDIVADTNHLHLWSLDGEKHVFTAHLILKNVESYSDILEAKKKIRDILKPYNFSHSTIEVELDEGTSSLIE
ncbi:MAG TPA: cation transporter [Balneolaceae bacterium]|jgi:cobalt-zinc-cadmium efflux system protein|uniref:cation diffusion facilitator family transporter n=1 Tax=Gracilimonas TaxID=649462 RepID=UPI000368E88D|nr:MULTISPECIES: cation diffusion facilitator family transporter [Gracilimonas]HCD52056.1 cation transporter [Balneolaceae bacterium]|tara:strand:- start:89769 stop:90647 length:879 start_codon:yes stop_codon:yes gene_type:complete